MTTKKDVDKLLAGVDFNKILKGAVKTSLAKNTQSLDNLAEGYIAQTKSYGQVTEFVSAKTKSAHKELYEHLVQSLNRVATEADTADKVSVDDRHNAYRSIKIDETRLLNGVWLHELFFANCFDPQSTIYMDSPAYLKLQKQWGTFDSWQADFMAAGIACGEGFVVTGYHMFLQQYVTTFVRDYSQDVMLGLFPILAIDMHQHAHQDFYNDRKNYIIAMMQEINWEVIDSRVLKVEAIANLLR